MQSYHVPTLSPIPENAAQGGRPTMSEAQLDANRVRLPKTPPRATKSTSDALLAVQKTPVVVNMGSVQRNSRSQSHKNEAVKDYIQTLFVNKVTRNHVFVDFIHVVYGFNKNDLKEPDGGYQLPWDAVNKYIDNGYSKHGTERAAYVPLKMIFESITEQFMATMSATGPGSGIRIADMKDRKVQGHFAEFKPDFIWSWVPEAMIQEWVMTGLSGELKKKKTEKFQFQVRVNLLKIPELTSQENHLATAPSSEAVAAEDETEAPSAPSTTTSGSNQGTKRKASSAPSSQESRASKKANSDAQSMEGSSTSRSKALTEHELQAVKYINELGSHGIRSYATGFLIVDYTMTVWYLDRMGVVKSASFNFITEPHYLVLFVAAVTSASFSQLGCFPLLKFPASPVSSDMLQTYKDVSLEFPAVDTSDTELSFILDVSTSRPSVPTYGAVGRATIVVPVKALSQAAKTLCGAGKLVSKISWQSKWRVPGEDGNITIVRTRLANDPATSKFLRNIVNMRHSLTLTMTEIGLPRAAMSNVFRTVDERVCRVLILEEYLPLSMVKSEDDFKRVFIDVVEAHHAIYEGSSILHRDISTNNIMLHYREDDKGIQSVSGVLCDWDLAKEVPPPSMEDIANDLMMSRVRTQDIHKYNDLHFLQKTQPTLQQPSGIVGETDTDRARSELRYRTGTGPFIALDTLLYLQVPRHLYRHDLESFFWVLVWFVTSHNPETQKLGGISDWLQNDLESIGNHKASYVTDYLAQSDLEANANPVYSTLLSTWVDTLRSQLIEPVYAEYQTFKSRLMGRLTKAQAREKALRPAASTDTTDGVEKTGVGAAGGGTVNQGETVDKVKAVVLRLVKSRESIIDFEAFRECLGPRP